jgi:DNA-binding transcriptional LysR family regulator
MGLTAAGEEVLEKARQVLLEVEELEGLASKATGEMRGTVRLFMPAALAVHQLAKHLPHLHMMYPEISLEVAAGFAHEPQDGYDITIVSRREAPDGDYIARRLVKSEAIVCASPGYLDRRGRPGHPMDLASHDLLVPRLQNLSRGLTLHRRHEGRDEIFTHTIARKSPLYAEHNDLLYSAALAGHGITFLSSFMIEDALLENALERVLPEWSLFTMTFWALLPSRKYLPATTRAVLDFLLSIFGGEDRDPWIAAAGVVVVESGKTQ